jgi:hypothetical protein
MSLSPFLSRFQSHHLSSEGKIPRLVKKFSNPGHAEANGAVDAGDEAAILRPDRTTGSD